MLEAEECEAEECEAEECEAEECEAEECEKDAELLLISPAKLSSSNNDKNESIMTEPKTKTIKD